MPARKRFNAVAHQGPRISQVQEYDVPLSATISSTELTDDDGEFLDDSFRNFSDESDAQDDPEEVVEEETIEEEVVEEEELIDFIEEEILVEESTYDSGEEPLVPAEEQNIDEKPNEETDESRMFNENSPRVKHTKSDICRICHEVSESNMSAVVRDVTHFSIREEDTRSLICLPQEGRVEDFNSGSLESPCLCKGTVGLVHRVCLERWLTETRRYTCELCGFHYETVRVPRLSAIKSLYVWCSGPVGRGKMFVFDVIKLTFLMPMSVLSTCLTLMVSKDSISRGGRYLFQNFRGTTPSLNSIDWVGLLFEGTKMFLTSSTTSLLLYCSTAVLCSAIDHYEAWYHWWQADSVVRLLETPPEARSARVVAEVYRSDLTLLF